ncbi:MAG: glutathione transporter permease [Proteobacteria bacterium]|nr:glutathione transporter permease [Pseudomonadota bacterium]
MIELILRRLGGALMILFGVAAITFVLLYALPADPAVQLAGRSATAQTVAISSRATLAAPTPRRPG